MDVEDFEATTAEEMSTWLEDVKSAVKVGSKNGGIDLTEWEENFVETCGKQTAAWSAKKTYARPLSSRQAMRLKQIWDTIK